MFFSARKNTKQSAQCQMFLIDLFSRKVMGARGKVSRSCVKNPPSRSLFPPFLRINCRKHVSFPLFACEVRQIFQHSTGFLWTTLRFCATLYISILASKCTFNAASSVIMTAAARLWAHTDTKT